MSLRFSVPVLLLVLGTCLCLRTACAVESASANPPCDSHPQNCPVLRTGKLPWGIYIRHIPRIRRANLHEDKHYLAERGKWRALY